MPQIGTKGQELDLLIRQGATFGPVSCTLKQDNGAPVNLTGALVRAQIRRAPNNTLSPGAIGTCSIVNAAAGVFQWEFSATQTALLPADITNEDSPASRYVWDMELEDSLGRVIPLVYGIVKVFREVTKDEA